MTIEKLARAAVSEITPLNCGVSAGVALVLTVIVMQLGHGAWWWFPLLTLTGMGGHVFWGLAKAVWTWDDGDKHEKRD